VTSYLEPCGGCHVKIPDEALAYGVELGGDHDPDTIVWLNGWHDLCLGEWGLRRDDSEFGVAHCAWGETA
jgi:hypothetical protein